MTARLTFRGGVISGCTSGRNLQCFVSPGHPGMLPAAGEYRIGGPFDDPVFGPIAVMVPSHGLIDPGIVEECMRRLPPPGGTSALFNPTGGRFRFNLPGGISEMPKQEMPSNGGALFVLTNRAVPGRNCLIVTSSPKELFGALAAVDETLITVS